MFEDLQNSVSETSVSENSVSETSVSENSVSETSVSVNTCVSVLDEEVSRITNDRPPSPSHDKEQSSPLNDSFISSSSGEQPVLQCDDAAIPSVDGRHSSSNDKQTPLSCDEGPSTQTDVTLSPRHRVVQESDV